MRAAAARADADHVVAEAMEGRPALLLSEWRVEVPLRCWHARWSGSRRYRLATVAETLEGGVVLEPGGEGVRLPTRLEAATGEYVYDVLVLQPLHVTWEVLLAAVGLPAKRRGEVHRLVHWEEAAIESDSEAEEGAEGEKDDEASVASAGSSHRGAVVGLNDGRPFPEEGGEGGDYVDRSGEEADAAGSTSNEEDVEGRHCDLASDADPARDADADADPPEDDGN